MEQTSSALPTSFNFARHIIELNTGRRDKLAYIDDVSRLTYGELSERIKRFAHSLRSLNLHNEERVLLLMHDGNDWPVAFLGSLYAGIVPVPVNTLLTADDYAYMLDHSEAAAVIVSASLLPILQSATARSSSGSVRHLIVSGTASGLPPRALGFSLLVASGDSEYQGVSTHAEGMAFWLYSSGSTGRAKGVVHTNANLFWTAELYGKPILRIAEDDRIFSAAKLFFAYGLGNGLTFPLSVGASVVLMAERATPEAVFARLTGLKPTIFCGAPTLYTGMLASPSLPTREEVALRICSSAGEALPRDIGERFAGHFGSDILDGIGSTEMLHIFLSNHPGDVHYGTTGRPVQGYELELRDESGHGVAIGEIGNLWVKGPSAALMYWNDRIRSRETFQGHWLHSGDKYACDAAGYYTYAGRNDDMLKVSGQYVSPFEVEGALARHPCVFEAAVVGVVDANGLMKSKAYVVLQRGNTPCAALADELKGFVKQTLAPFKRPHYIEFVPELPKTATGKIQRFKLRELASHQVAA